MNPTDPETAHETTITTPDLPLPSDNAPPPFPVRSQLLLLAGFLLFLFAIAGGSLAQFMSSLSEEIPPAEHPVSPVATVSEALSSPYPIAHDITLEAKAALVLDVRTGTVLFERNSDEIVPLASITKLMTALVAYELLEGEHSITVPGSATTQQSASGLRGGDSLTATGLTKLALIASANDAAYSLAASAGELLGERDPVSQFIAAMNIRAGELGLNSLTFRNTTGLDLTNTEAGAVGNARDVTQLVAILLTEYPELLRSTTQPQAKVAGSFGETYEAENTNALIGQIPNLLASKTGYTDLAGGNLTVAFDIGFDRPIIITVLGSTRSGRFADVTKLADAVMGKPAP